MTELSTSIGKVQVAAKNAAVLVVTGTVTLFSAAYDVHLTLTNRTFGFIRSSFDDLVLTRQKDGGRGSYPDREKALEVLVEVVNTWADTTAGKAARAAAQKEATQQERSLAELHRVGI